MCVCVCVCVCAHTAYTCIIIREGGGQESGMSLCLGKGERMHLQILHNCKADPVHQTLLAFSLQEPSTGCTTSPGPASATS